MRYLQQKKALEPMPNSKTSRPIGAFACRLKATGKVTYVALVTAAILIGQGTLIPFLPKASATPVQIVLTSGTTWTVPPAWDNTANTIEAIGAGGNGASGVNSTYAGAGGGGGEYRKASNVTLTPNATISINIPSGGAGSTAAGAWLKNSSGTIVIEAKNGGNASGATAGTGGTGGTGSAANYNGGNGGSGGSGNNNDSAGGGGGSAGPSGAGKNGGNGVGATSMGGGGGGGSNGGSSSAGITPTGVAGGDGGNSTTGTGAGTGGSGRNTNDAGSGLSGGGGGGGSQSTGATPSIGGGGSVEDLWGTGIGPSGGGGGGGGCGGTGCTVSHLGGDGGTYGGGAGGCGMSGSHAAANCPSTPAGGQGIIVITYTPSVSPAINQSNYRLFSNPTGLGTTPWQACRTESGETTIPGGSASSTVTLTTPITDMTQSYLLTRATGDSSVTSSNAHMVAGEVTNSTTLTFTRGASSSGVAQVSYSLVECFQNEFSVQRGQTVIASGASSNTATITSVDTTKSIVLVSGYNDDSASTEQTGLATGELQNATTVLVRRFNTPAVNNTINWQVVTFSSGSGASVQTGETTLASGSASQTASITSVNTGSSWLYCSYDADSSGLQQDAVGCDLTNATTVTVNRYSAKTYTNRVRWYVVSFPSADVSVQRGALADAGGTTDGVRYDVQIPITAVNSTTRTFPFITNTTSGTGTAFPRSDWIYQLTATDNLQTSYWRGSSSGSGTHYWQVIEFLAPPTDVGSPLAAQNSSATLSAAGRTFRLRMLLGVSAATLGQGTSFKLQYAALSGSCGASTYSDVTTSTPFAFYNHPELSNGTPLTANASDPTDGSNPIDTQTYIENNNFANDVGFISPGSDGEWDFSLYDNGSSPNSTYCFRIVHASGAALDTYSAYPQITSSDGVFSAEIVNGSGGIVSSPSVAMSTGTLKLSCSQTTGTLGTTTQKVRVINHSSNVPWTMNVAATAGATSLWSDGTDNFDFNDPAGSPPGCAQGTDADTFAGLLNVGFGSTTITPSTGCTTDGVTAGVSTAFNQGTTDSITLGRASSTATNGCYWDFNNISLTQTIPAEQHPGTYSLDLTITLTAN